MSLSVGSSPQLPPISRPGGNPPTFDGNEKQDDTNHGAVSAWVIPAGKNYDDFFNKKKFPYNTKGWPKATHHKKKGENVLCLKFQVMGRCRTDCSFSHVDPRSMDKTTFEQISTKFKQIYKK
jgi:hypothetical protein